MAKQWYTRKDGQCSGPYPEGQIRRHALLGRLRPDHEVSRDRETWQRLQDVPVFSAELRRLTGAAQDWEAERLSAARRWADERAGERRSARASDNDGRRRRDRREGPEPEVLIELRRAHARTQHMASQRPFSKAGLYVVPGLLMALLAAVAWFSQPAPRVTLATAPPDCGAPPAPRMNGEGCDFRGRDWAGLNLKDANLRNARLDGSHLAGADLRYADLRGTSLRTADLGTAQLWGVNLEAADLRGAQLAGADLRYASLAGARVEGADFLGARLEHTTWVDGRPCAPGSVGRCR